MRRRGAASESSVAVARAPAFSGYLSTAPVRESPENAEGSARSPSPLRTARLRHPAAASLRPWGSLAAERGKSDIWHVGHQPVYPEVGEPADSVGVVAGPGVHGQAGFVGLAHEILVDEGMVRVDRDVPVLGGPIDQP